MDFKVVFIFNLPTPALNFTNSKNEFTITGLLKVLSKFFQGFQRTSLLVHFQFKTKFKVKTVLKNLKIIKNIFKYV